MEVVTSRMAGRKIRKKPDTMAGRISGRVTSARLSVWLAPQTRAASSSGKLRGAAVDVVSKEPIDPNNPLLTAPNLLMTPHIAWAPLEARQRLLTIAEENLQAYAAGQPINVVNN